MVICVTYEGCLQNLLVASVYMAIDKGLPVAELDNIIRHSESTGIPVVIAGDSNAHHPARGCQEQNEGHPASQPRCHSIYHAYYVTRVKNQKSEHILTKTNLWTDVFSWYSWQRFSRFIACSGTPGACQ